MIVYICMVFTDYQMKESGYESSSGQIRANGFAHPPIYPNSVDEDDNQPPTLTAGDRLLRQINAGEFPRSKPLDVFLSDDVSITVLTLSRVD